MGFIIFILVVIVIAVIAKNHLYNDSSAPIARCDKQAITQRFCNILSEKCGCYNYSLLGKTTIDDRGNAHFTLIENSNGRRTYHCGFDVNPYSGYCFIDISSSQPKAYASSFKGRPNFNDEFFQALFQRLDWCKLSQYEYAGLVADGGRIGLPGLTVIPLHISEEVFIGFEAFLMSEALQLSSVYYITLQDLRNIGFPLFSKYSKYKYGLPSSDLKLEYNALSRSPHCYRSGSDILIEINHQTQKFESNISNQPELIKRIMWTYANYHADIERNCD